MEPTTVQARRMRRKPKQARSQHRVDDILKAAMELVGEKGIAALTMREIANTAGIPLASVYQYFPNRSAVIATLYQEVSRQTRENVAERVAKVQAPEHIIEAAYDAVEMFYMRMRENPAILDLMVAIQGDKTLLNMDIEETKKQADIFNQGTRHLIQEEDRPQYERAARILFHLAGATVRISLRMEAEVGERVVEDYKMLIYSRLNSFIHTCPAFETAPVRSKTANAPTNETET
ncbi:TetR/AcrR family transcriptional regulator [Pseudohoeflea suaedae]|nr:TetR/AcrR family transcriptional regulator [Pseudohoeflea suaedae]